MNHPTAEDLLDLALDTLEEGRLRKVASHIARCDACGPAYAELRAEQEALHQAFDQIEPGAKNLESKVLKRLPAARAAGSPGGGPAVAVILGVIAAGFFIAVAAILFVPRNDPRIIIDRLYLLDREANELDAAGRFDEAIAAYNRALELTANRDGFRSRALMYRARIKELEADQLALAEANRRFFELKVEHATAKGADAHHELLKRAKTLRNTYRDSDIITWHPELKLMIEQIEKVLDTEAATNRRLDFQVRRNEIMGDCGLSGDPNKALWGRAITAWSGYLREEVATNSKAKAQNEIWMINNRARDNFQTLRNRVRRMVDADQKADAIEYLKTEASRFKGTQSEESFQDLLKGLDQ